VDVDESLRRYGLRPGLTDLPAIREVLRVQGELDQMDQDTELMRLSCAQLFHRGLAEDALLIWAAKESSFDAHCSIDVQLLCGAGLAETKAFLQAANATGVLQYLAECEAAGDFDRFTVDGYAEMYADYYRN
jgi:hypothetical protein